MSKKFNEHSQINLSKVNKEILDKWDKENIFQESIKLRQGAKPFVFYEGPPSANGVPGIHHVMARSIKDIFCRYKTMKGFLVNRKAGWDTHGLPVELSVEKSLKITKEDIGKKISVAEYNNACRKDVMKYTDLWEKLTKDMGYWVDMSDPYVTYDNRYIETLWYLLKTLYNDKLLYKGYTIQPYSPAAGTGLSTHELNQPGCYKDVTDTTVMAQFKIKNPKEEMTGWGNPYFIAWTTTPWTLPSNTALAVGENIEYVAVQTYNKYTHEKITVVCAKNLVNNIFDAKAKDIPLDQYSNDGKKIPFKIVGEWQGKNLQGMQYEQLFPWVNPGENAFQVITGDFVTTEDGTGIVHIAPTFGADDARVAKINNVPSLLLVDENGTERPMVDLTGKYYNISQLDSKFVETKMNKEEYNKFAGRYVKNAYDDTLSNKDRTLDIDLSILLKEQNKAFNVEKNIHNYPHCWRTDKPILYYPLDSWFIKTTSCKEEMIALNKTINWKPESTGVGRFGKWLENLQDWNLSRSRYWGTPLPIWRTEDGTEEICIGSVKELYAEIDKSIEAGFMKDHLWKGFKIDDMSKENYNKIDLHRPFVDDIILVSKSGKPMKRESDLIDVWFDSGAMPFAQVFYPHISNDDFSKVYPADFIAEGVDQTRGWFFTLHAISTMIKKQIAFKNVISNGLVLDKLGQKMSKRLGNAVDPFETIEKYGSDPLRWYMISNASPWDNLKFDIKGVEEVQRKFFGTLFNTYSFFTLYANVDGFTSEEKQIPLKDRQEIDRWILSLLNSLIKDVDNYYNAYEPTKAARAISNFVNNNLSNWYVRLCRKRFWGGGLSQDKLAAYQTLYKCLVEVSKLIAPISPFYSDMLYCDLMNAHGKETTKSVHLADFSTADESAIDKGLEERMEIAQLLSSMILALRRKENIKVRQPLQKIIVPVVDEAQKNKFEAVKELILNETNIKEIEYVGEDSSILIKKIKADFKKLGPRFGKEMKTVANAISEMSQKQINELAKNGFIELIIDNNPRKIELSDVEIVSEDIPGWLVANEGNLTVALDVTITPELKNEGIARELVNRIQNMRKNQNFEITDRINVMITKFDGLEEVLKNNSKYITDQVLGDSINSTENLPKEGIIESMEIENYKFEILIEKV